MSRVLPRQITWMQNKFLEMKWFPHRRMKDHDYKNMYNAENKVFPFCNTFYGRSQQFEDLRLRYLSDSSTCYHCDLGEVT